MPLSLFNLLWCSKGVIDWGDEPSTPLVGTPFLIDSLCISSWIDCCSAIKIFRHHLMDFFFTGCRMLFPCVLKISSYTTVSIQLTFLDIYLMQQSRYNLLVVFTSWKYTYINIYIAYLNHVIYLSFVCNWLLLVCLFLNLRRTATNLTTSGVE